MLPMPAIILAIENDDDRSFMESLFNSYQRLIYQKINRIVHDDWLTEDLLQTTIVNLINNLQNIRDLDERTLTAYICISAEHIAISELRKRKRKHQLWFDDLSVAENQADNNTPEIIILKSEDNKAFVHVWNKLDSRSKYLLRSRFILKKDYSEMAQELNIKPESVRMAITRAKRVAINLWKQEFETAP